MKQSKYKKQDAESDKRELIDSTIPKRRYGVYSYLADHFKQLDDIGNAMARSLKQSDSSPV